ncbi:MAG: ParB/RepB/Spo0J family partition protein [bacterium]|nr:ParB/RepB/Spo0J family partition protein [bacterium]
MPLGGGLNSLIPPKRDGGALSSPPPKQEAAPISLVAPRPAPSSQNQNSQGSSFNRDPFNRATAAGVHHGVPARPDSVRFASPSTALAPAASTRLPPSGGRQPRGEDSVFQIEVEKIKPNPYQPRREFESQALGELAQSIRDFGIIQPLVVTKAFRETPTGTDVEYQLITGERRLEAAKLAGLERVPAIVRHVDERRTKLELALIENIQRSDLSPIDAARAYARLQNEFGLTQREVAARVGKSREVVANAVRLLALPPTVQAALTERKINESQARTLLALSSPEAQLAALDAILNRKLSVRALKREMVREAPPKNSQDVFLERRLEERIGAPVAIARQGARGRITVQFYSEEELEGIVGRLTGENGD